MTVMIFLIQGSLTGYNNVSDYEEDSTGMKYIDRTLSLVTGNKVLILGTSDYLTTTNYYDDRYRIIQSLRDIYTGTSGYEVNSNKYNFVGEVLQTHQKQFTSAQDSIWVDTYYSYDSYGRLLTTEHQINDGDTVLLSENTYSDLGQLKKKGLHEGSSGFIQEVDYDYNIRGWLAGINDQTDLEGDLFAMRLFYNDVSALSPFPTVHNLTGTYRG